MLKENLILLKDLRELQAARVKILKVKKEEFEEQNKNAIDIISTASININECEEKIRNEALIEFKKTGEKSLDFGVGIRIMKNLDYDEKEAFNWAKDHSLALSLDKKTFEKIAKTNEIDFVKITENATATIPKEINVGDQSDS